MNKNQIKKQSEASLTQLRKDEHLKLALSSKNTTIDERFYYDPFLAKHPTKKDTLPAHIGDVSMKFPIWISSMTGGTQKTNTINKRLAKAAKKYGLGMAVGSVRIALEDSTKITDFDLRPILGDTTPYFLNFGVAQIEKMITSNSIEKITELTSKLNANGVIIHVNPLQEWLQPEGDQFENAPIDTIKSFLNQSSIPLIVKEVGQGFGMESLRELMQLPLTAIEFAANGGTNFSKLELDRNSTKMDLLSPFINVGHTAEEMVDMSNVLLAELGNKCNCSSFIISGGVRHFLDGYYLLKKSKANAVYGQASGFLRYAQKSQEELNNYIETQIEGLLLAQQYLSLKD